jgi:hypothetical protein
VVPDEDAAGALDAGTGVAAAALVVVVPLVAVVVPWETEVDTVAAEAPGMV